MFKNAKIASLSFIVVALLLNACKETAILDRSLVPAIDNISTFQSDTFTVLSNNIYTSDIYNKQIVTSGLSFPALGSIANDPVVGNTIASIALQVRQPNALFTFTGDSTTLVADSLILSIPLSINYGDTNRNTCLVQTINAYRLSDTLSKDSTYYNNSSVAYDNNLLGSATINMAKHALNDSITLAEGKVGPQLRIKLSQALADSLIHLSSSVQYQTTSIFTSWLKGIYLTPADTTNGNSLGYFNIASAQMKLYTHAKVGTVADSAIAYVYPLDNTVNAHFNRITKNYTTNNPQIKNYINTGNALGDSLLFIQGNVGNVIELTMPFLSKFDNVVVNKADFIFTQLASAVPATDSLYWPPARLKAVGIDENGVDYTLVADYLDDANFAIADGIRRSDTTNGNVVVKYKVNLAHFIQKMIVTRNNKLKLKIVAVNSQIASGRTVLGGSSNKANKLKLNIIYTKIK